MRAFMRPEDIAGVAIAVQPDRADVPGSIEYVFHFFERHVQRRKPCLLQIPRHHARDEQPVARFRAEGLHAQGRAQLERPRRAHRVDAPEKAPDPLQHLLVLQLRRAAAAAREHRETEFGEVVQAAAVDHQRRDHRDLALRQFERKRMVLEDLRVAPALRAVELRHAVGIVFEAELKTRFS